MIGDAACNGPADWLKRERDKMGGNGETAEAFHGKWSFFFLAVLGEEEKYVLLFDQTHSSFLQRVCPQTELSDSVSEP